MLPTFLVIGAQKAGTSSLHAYLHAQPDVFVSATKELDYFVAERNWRRGQAWYEAQFAGAAEYRAAGESSPLYTMYPSFPGVPERIRAVVPDVRLVYLVRDPIARLRSHYLHVVAEGGERRPIDAVARDDSGLIAFSLYAMQLEQYLEHFGRDQLLVLPTERLRDDRERTVRRVLAFIGADAAAPLVGLDREAHRSDEKQVPRRGLRAVGRLASSLPSRVGGPLRRLSHRPIAAIDTTVPPPLERELRRQFREQLPLLRSFVGPDWDGWGLA